VAFFWFCKRGFWIALRATTQASWLRITGAKKQNFTDFTQEAMGAPLQARG
jgi:hypothetical protein